MDAGMPLPEDPIATALRDAPRTGRIDLSHLNLTVIPPEVFLLNEVAEIDLSHNALLELPWQAGRCRASRVNLEGNLLDGGGYGPFWGVFEALATAIDEDNHIFVSVVESLVPQDIVDFFKRVIRVRGGARDLDDLTGALLRGIYFKTGPQVLPENIHLIFEAMGRGGEEGREAEGLLRFCFERWPCFVYEPFLNYYRSADPASREWLDAFYDFLPQYVSCV